MSLAREHPLAVALSCHDPELVERIADEVVELGTSQVPRSRTTRGTDAPTETPAERGSPETGPADVPVLDARDLRVTFGRRSDTPTLDGVTLTVALDRQPASSAPRVPEIPPLSALWSGCNRSLPARSVSMGCR